MIPAIANPLPEDDFLDRIPKIRLVAAIEIKKINKIKNAIPACSDVSLESTKINIKQNGNIDNMLNMNDTTACPSLSCD